ncbi:Hypotetical protein [Gulosibacter molinativorax]|nr:Hypotetical protein [Gulosibacter molinativorax]
MLAGVVIPALIYEMKSCVCANPRRLPTTMRMVPPHPFGVDDVIPEKET